MPHSLGSAVKTTFAVSVAERLLKALLRSYWEFVAGSVIQATGTVEFEDGLRTGVLQEDCWCPCGVRTKPMVTAKHPFGVGHDPGGGGDDLGL